MPRQQRKIAGDTYYHLFNRGVNKQAIYWDDEDKSIFTNIVANTAINFDLTVFAYCLMPNHFHLFLKTKTANLNEAMQWFQSQYVQFINRRHQRVGPLFQSRYKSNVVESDQYAMWLVRYIHRNPIPTLSGELGDYKWSSYPCYLGLSSTNWLNTTWALSQFHADPKVALKEFVKFHLEEAIEGSDPALTPVVLRMV